MSEAKMSNLDVQCANLGRDIARISGMDEKTINAALSVLEGQGPYAMFLYLKARHTSIVNSLENVVLSLLQRVFGDSVRGANGILGAVERMADDLDRLLFVRELLLTAFSYARYHIKAKEGGER